MLIETPCLALSQQANRTNFLVFRKTRPFKYVKQTNKQKQNSLHLNDQHVLPEVITLFEDYSDGCQKVG